MSLVPHSNSLPHQVISSCVTKQRLCPWVRSAVRKYGGRVRKCLTILSNFLSNFVSLITVFSF